MALPDSGTPMVEARSLAKNYGSTRALSGISFSISRGEVVGFLGPNGAGKSTTMKIMTGFLRPTKGSVYVCGDDVSQAPLATRKRIGYLPESAPLYNDMMVLDYLVYIAELRGVPHEEIKPRLRNICKRCGLLDVLGKDVGQLSKGFRQRVGLAQAIVHDPDIVVLDEPTSGLDPNQIVEIRELIKDLGKEKTVILSTHILPEVEATCDRIIIINQGKIVADDTPQALAERNSGSRVRMVVRKKGGGTPELSQLIKVFGALPGVREVTAGEGEGAFNLSTTGNEDPREALFNAAVGNELMLLDIYREQASLEDTFRRLTRGAEGEAR